jgi:sortase (surface protein transpeptidase)
VTDPSESARLAGPSEPERLTGPSEPERLASPSEPEQPAGSLPRHRRPVRRPVRRRRTTRSLSVILVACGLGLTVLGVGGWTVVDHIADEHQVSQSGRFDHQPGHTGAAAQAQGRVGRIAAAPGQPARAVARPAWLLIPAIGVSTSLIKLGLTAQHTLQVPSTTAVAGWYTGSPRPGEVGAAIIAGHIDSYLGPGIFYRLSQLKRGQYVYVIRANHTVAVFEVTATHLYAKARFPADAVYGPAPAPELRLITCGGTFDYATRSYLSNVVVTAIEVS